MKNSNIEEEETIYKNYYSYVDDQELKESNWFNKAKDGIRKKEEGLTNDLLNEKDKTIKNEINGQINEKNKE